MGTGDGGARLRPARQLVMDYSGLYSSRMSGIRDGLLRSQLIHDVGADPIHVTVQ